MSEFSEIESKISTVLGYHGTKESNVESILSEDFKPGKEDSWVGTAIYFWERDKELAFHWCQINEYIPPAVIAAEIKTSECMLDLVTEEGKSAFREFINKFKQSQKNVKQLDSWIAANGTQFCDTYFVQLMFKMGVVLAVRFVAMASDEALNKKPRTFVYNGKQQEIYRSRFLTNIRIILALRDSSLIRSKYRCKNERDKTTR